MEPVEVDVELGTKVGGGVVVNVGLIQEERPNIAGVSFVGVAA